MAQALAQNLVLHRHVGLAPNVIAELRFEDTSRVIATMKKFLSSHPLCMKALEYSYPAGARYLFRRGDDPDRHFYLTALVFDVPAPEK